LALVPFFTKVNVLVPPGAPSTGEATALQDLLLEPMKTAKPAAAAMKRTLYVLGKVCGWPTSHVQSAILMVVHT